MLLISLQKNLFLQINDNVIFDDLDSDILIFFLLNFIDEEYLYTLIDIEGIFDLFDLYEFWNEV